MRTTLVIVPCYDKCFILRHRGHKLANRRNIPTGFEMALGFIESALDVTLPDPRKLATEEGRLEYAMQYGKLEHLKDLKAMVANQKRREARQ